MLSLQQLTDVCLAKSTGSDRCRFLHQDPTDPAKFFCLKLSPKAKIIEQSVLDFIVDKKRKGLNPYAENMPLGDNCEGYPVMRNLLQGYDQD